MHSKSADAASQSQESRLASSSVNDVIHYECMNHIFVYRFHRTLQVRKISGMFPEKNPESFRHSIFPEKLQPYA